LLPDACSYPPDVRRPRRRKLHARRADCRMGAKAAFGCYYLKATPNFQKSQFMENSRLPRSA
jgi:hypothetical protein